ncbi:hypothetical protein PEC311524_40800 [Pectobacterium carotovorum subsp. carotovorum]|nr:hypothetical protein PEC311524_40800 [Pectobacterium carotovorum subsp. carotovorum]
MDKMLLHLNRYNLINYKLTNIKKHKNKIYKQGGKNKKKPTNNSGRGIAIIVI